MVIEMPSMKINGNLVHMHYIRAEDSVQIKDNFWNDEVVDYDIINPRRFYDTHVDLLFEYVLEFLEKDENKKEINKIILNNTLRGYEFNIDYLFFPTAILEFSNEFIKMGNVYLSYEEKYNGNPFLEYIRDKFAVQFISLSSLDIGNIHGTTEFRLYYLIFKLFMNKDFILLILTVLSEIKDELEQLSSINSEDDSDDSV